MDDAWKAYMTAAEQAKIENLEYEIRMIMNRCIIRARGKDRRSTDNA